MEEKLMKTKIPVLKVMLVLLIFLTATFILYSVNKENETLSHDKTYLNAQIQIVEDNQNEEIMKVSKSDAISIFSEDYQDVIDKKIQALQKKKTYTIKHPLLIYNPYGTGSLSYYFAFEAEENLKVSYQIETDGYPSFKKTLPKIQNNKEYSYQLIGFIPGTTNWLTITLQRETGEIVEEKRITVKTKTLTSIDTKMELQEGQSQVPLTEGLYAVLGHDKAYNSNVYLFDNEGILRNELILEGYRADRIIQTEDALYYSFSKNGFIKVNSKGKIEKIYTFDSYEMHHDYVYDAAKNQMVILANKKGKETIEDEIITLSLKTGKITNTLDMKSLLKEFYQNAVKPEKNTYGGDELDWLHLNSLQVIGDDLLLSSRELSTLIYVENAFSTPKIRYLITDPSVLEKTSYESLNLTKEGTFISQAGQHSVTYRKDESQEDGKYTLAIYNNNYQGARTRPNFNWKNYEGTGTYEEGDASYYYEYEIDEENHSYRLVKKFAVPYSSIVSNFQWKGDHYIVSSGMSHCYGEYDSEGTLIREYRYTAKKYAYRVFKYEFNHFWFE